MPLRLDAIDAAAVALLEPVFTGGPDWRAALREALAGLADQAMRIDAVPQFETLAELAVMLQARLDAVPSATDEDEALRGEAGGWAADLLDLCAGRLSPGQASALAFGDDELAARLDELARMTQRLRTQPAPQPSSPPAPCPGRELPSPAREDHCVAEHARSEPEAWDATGTAPEVAVDELELLAQETEVLLADFSGEGHAPATFAGGDAGLQDGLLRVADATRLIGLSALADLIEGSLQIAPPIPFGAHPAAVLQDLASLFRSAGAERGYLDRLSAIDEVLRAPARAAHAQLDALRVVGTRQAGAAALASEGAEVDLSLDIPADADRVVVESLLSELEPLSAQLSAAIAALGADQTDARIHAQRVAHTLKGAANTVGVRGIAAITHGIEDLLELLALRDPDQSLRPRLNALLEDAADCVAEMCETVIGRSAAPSQARTEAKAVHAGLTAEIGRLVDEIDAGAAARPRIERRKADRRRLERRQGDRLTSMDRASLLEPRSAGSESTGQAQASPSARSDAGRAGAPDGATSPEPADALDLASQGELRVPAALLARMLDLVDEAAIIVGQAGDQAQEMERSRQTMRLGGDQLQDLASELERLVDVRAVAVSDESEGKALDSLELDEYNDLHTVSRRIAESGADGKLVEQQLGATLGALRDSLARLERLQAELRDCALRTRMARFGSIAARLHRTVRQSARMAEKEVVLQIDGEDTLVDAGLLGQIGDALAHLLRNAVDHGIEAPADRLQSGKPRTGRIVLDVSREGASWIFSCSDDGGGIDEDAVRERASAAGLLPADGRLDQATLLATLLTPGFSTRARASQLSGRGIGLDVVHQIVERLRGSVGVESTLARSTRFTLTVPVGLAALPVMLIRGEQWVLALSVRGIERIVALAPADSERVPETDVAVMPIEGLLALAESDQPALARTERARSALLVRAADGVLRALSVPEPSAPRSLVVRPLPAHVPRLPGFDGVAVLGDGTVAPVLDLVALLAGHAQGVLRGVGQARLSARAELPTAPLCLVVDDSVSVRRTTEIFVRDLGFEVQGAADGIEALESIERRVPDLLIVDLEMPRMNGIELVRQMRAAARTATVPVIMITSRYSQRHKQLALDAGVDVFVTKPYTEDALAERIHACMKDRFAQA